MSHQEYSLNFSAQRKFILSRTTYFYESVFIIGMKNSLSFAVTAAMNKKTVSNWLENKRYQSRGMFPTTSVHLNVKSYK